MAKKSDSQIKLPRNEIGQTEILNPRSGEIEYLITQNNKTGRFTIFKIKGSEAEKLSTANNPIDLENKYLKRKGSK